MVVRAGGADAGPLFHVHAAGCRDLRKAGYRWADSFPLEASTVLEVAEQVYPRGAFDWEDADGGAAYLGDFRVYPCAHLEHR